MLEIAQASESFLQNFILNECEVILAVIGPMISEEE